MQIIDFIKDLKMIELITDQLWLSLAVWGLFIYLAVSQNFGWLTSLVLVIGGALLSLLSVIKWFKGRKTAKLTPPARFNSPRIK